MDYGTEGTKGVKSPIFLMMMMMMMLIAVCFGGCRGQTEKPWTPGQPLDKEKVKIGVIYVDDATGGYSYAHYLGLEAMRLKLSISESQLIPQYNVNDADAIMVEAMMREAIAKGANIIVAISWGHMDVCEKLAEVYPNVIFANATGYKSNGTNFTNYFGRIYQARFLSGIVAGLKTESNKIGYVAAMDKSNSEVTGGVNAFALGVESVNPDAKIYVRVTHSWFDPQGEAQATRVLLGEGCDVIAQHCDTPAPQQTAEKAGAWGIGYNSNMSKEAPNAVLTSVIWNWDIYYTKLIQSIIDGSFTTEPYLGSLRDGMVDITPINETLTAPGTKIAVEAAKERFLNGKFNVFDGVMETNDGQEKGAAGGTFSDGEISGGMNWYYRNVVEF
jgi:basic membrane protein A